jgi:hypothetical protein
MLLKYQKELKRFDICIVSPYQNPHHVIPMYVIKCAYKQLQLNMTYSMNRTTPLFRRNPHHGGSDTIFFS